MNESDWIFDPEPVILEDLQGEGKWYNIGIAIHDTFEKLKRIKYSTKGVRECH